VDTADEIVVHGGVGPDGTDPALNDLWVWSESEPSTGWIASSAGEPNNDEYQAELVASDPGLYDFAFRASADQGLSWTYCDRSMGFGSDGSEDGYQPENAGSLVVLEEACPTICGDVNMDGELTAADSSLIQDIALGLTVDSECILHAGDVSGDGVVNVSDIVQLNAALTSGDTSGLQCPNL